MSISVAQERMTTTLPPYIISDLKYMVEKGYASTMNSIIKDALEEYLTKMKKQQYFDKIKTASVDREFIKRNDDTMKDFEYADSEADLW